MQVLATSRNPIRCALNMDDRRARKLLIEAAQLLCTALHERSIPDTVKVRLYKSVSNRKSGLVQWPGYSRSNFVWLTRYYEALCKRYYAYSGRDHATAAKRTPEFFYEAASYIPDGAFTDPPNATQSQQYQVSFKHIPDVYLAYRKYLKARWALESEATGYAPAMHISVGILRKEMLGETR